MQFPFNKLTFILAVDGRKTAYFRLRRSETDHAMYLVKFVDGAWTGTRYKSRGLDNDPTSVTRNRLPRAMVDRLVTMAYMMRADNDPA